MISPESKTGAPLIRVFACGIALILLQLAAVPAGLSAGIPSNVQRGSEVVPHAQVGNVVTFSLGSAPSAVTLQGRLENSGRWKNLVVSRNPKRSLAQLQIPRRWSEAELRVVANFASDNARRVRIKSRTDLDTRTVRFIATPRARLYSVEYTPDGLSPWERVCTVATSPKPKSVSVHLPNSVPAGAKVRVMAVSGPRQGSVSLATPLSEQMREGPTVFAPSVKAASAAPLYASEGLRGSVASSASGDDTSGTAPNQEESDIWKMRGQKIYFFNRLRGLQIIDASVPTDPEMLGSLPMAGAGEEMYLLGSDPARADAALLVTGVPWSPDSPDATRLSLVGLAGEQPEVETSMEIPGYYVDSRLVGSMLHVVTASWTSTSGNWSPRTFLTTVDLSHSGDIQAQTPAEFTCAPHSVGATDKYFWFAGPRPGSWSEHTLFAFPYQTDGSLAEPLQAVLGGAVQDKFKVGDTADGLAVVVQSWSAWQSVTSVKTYAEEEGDLVTRGQLELVRNEWLFATRFDRDRLYVVTFEQTDPLWIVDLSDSSKPQIRGHLEVPGWSNYIQPLGDVLLAVGRDGGKVQVSMFDVSDPDNPARTGLVDLGQAGGWSWTEAEWNEKAVKILPEAGLMLVPVVEWNNGARSNRVALVDFDATGRTLSARGTINHDFSPRRAALMDDDVIASVSNRELLLFNASDRGNPQFASETTLAFGVDRLLVYGGIALMFENGGDEWSSSPREAVLRTAPVANTDDTGFELELPCTRVEAAEIFGDRMVVVESSRQDLLWALSRSAAASPAGYDCHISVWSLQDVANPVLLGRTELPFAAGTDMKILPATEGHVVVVSRERAENFFIRPLPLVMADSAAISADLPLSRPWFGWGNQQLKLAVADISGSEPAVVGTWELKGDQIAGISDVFAAGDLLAFSYEDRVTIKGSTNLFPWSEDWSAWRASSWLQIVDLANPASPMPWAPVELPGELVGVSWLQRAGGVLFARSGEDRIAALGFDGESAALAAEIPAGPVFAMQGGSLYFSEGNGVSEWIFSEDSGAWQRGPGWVFDPRISIQELHVADGALLAGNWRNAWILREDGSVSADEVPPGADIGSAAAAAESFLVPAGEYGAVRLD